MRYSAGALKKCRERHERGRIDFDSDTDSDFDNKDFPFILYDLYDPLDPYVPFFLS